MAMNNETPQIHEVRALDEADAGAPSTLWTIGHSTRSWEAFVALLHLHRIEAVVDVRRFPGSRRYPWFASDVMASALAEIGLAYVWLPQLGGRRRAQPGSPNGAWRNAAFQGYADHMNSAEFQQAFTQVTTRAASTRSALMCAEALWWQCHRRLISDLLVHRGHAVLHVMSEKPAQPHQLTLWRAGGRRRFDLSAAAGRFICGARCVACTHRAQRLSKLQCFDASLPARVMSSADREREPCSPLPLRNAVGKATLPLRTSTHDACPCLPCLHSRPLSPAVIGISKGDTTRCWAWFVTARHWRRWCCTARSRRT